MTTLNVFSSSFHFIVSSLKLGFVLNVIRLGVDKTIKHTFNILLQDSQRICDHFITSTNILSQTLWKFCRKAQFPHSFGRIASFGWIDAVEKAIKHTLNIFLQHFWRAYDHFVTNNVKNTLILPNFLVWKFCRKAQFPQSFCRIAQNYV